MVTHLILHFCWWELSGCQLWSWELSMWFFQIQEDFSSLASPRRWHGSTRITVFSFWGEWGICKWLCSGTDFKLWERVIPSYTQTNGPFSETWPCSGPCTAHLMCTHHSFYLNISFLQLMQPTLGQLWLRHEGTSGKSLDPTIPYCPLNK